MGSVDFEDLEAKTKIASWREQPGMLGPCYTFLHEPARQWVADGTLDWLGAAAEEADVPVSVLATDCLATSAGSRRGTRPARYHRSPGGWGGLTTLKDEEAMVHIPELLALAKLPNVAVKATWRARLFYRGVSFEDAYPLQQIYGVLTGCSGGPIFRRCRSWGECVRMFTEELSWLDARDKRLSWVRRSAPVGLTAIWETNERKHENQRR